MLALCVPFPYRNAGYTDAGSLSRKQLSWPPLAALLKLGSKSAHVVRFAGHFFTGGFLMAMPFTGNDVWNHIAEAARDREVDATAILRMIATFPPVVQAVESALENRNDPNYDPDAPGGNPADSVIASLADVLTRTPDGESIQPLY